jgi:hypothetical protein
MRGYKQSISLESTKMFLNIISMYNAGSYNKNLEGHIVCQYIYQKLFLF